MHLLLKYEKLKLICMWWIVPLCVTWTFIFTLCCELNMGPFNWNMHFGLKTQKIRFISRVGKVWKKFFELVQVILFCFLLFPSTHCFWSYKNGNRRQNWVTNAGGRHNLVPTLGSGVVCHIDHTFFIEIKLLFF